MFFSQQGIDNPSLATYLEYLKAISKLSGLFSDSAVPLINYRAVENMFCRGFGAENLSRSDTAFDAKYNQIGIGLKTFVALSNTKTEKVAEFNSLSRELSELKGIQLARELARKRNERIDLAKRVYNIDKALYHIVARRIDELLLFETDYDYIDINNIRTLDEKSKTSLKFTDGVNDYSYNFSKSTLFRQFTIPDNALSVSVEILKDPFEVLLEIGNLHRENAVPKLIRGIDYVVLPLYGKSREGKFVFEKSGLNQWNAGGRKRNPGELYIPIPKEIHKLFPNFFPLRDNIFALEAPTKECFSAKLCQDDSKALMTNPNKELSDWLLRKVLLLKEKEILTIEHLKAIGIDSVIVYKLEANRYKIDIMKWDSYENFISNEDYEIED